MRLLHRLGLVFRTDPKLSARAVGLLRLFKDAAIRWSDDDCLRLGASLAYYVAFSIFPLLLLVLTAVGFVLGDSPEARSRLVETVASATSPAFKTLVDGTLRNMQEHQTARGVGAVVGVAMLIVGASAAFSELETTLNQIRRVERRPACGFWAIVVVAARTQVLSFAVVIVAAVALLGSLVSGAVVSLAWNQTMEGGVRGVTGDSTTWSALEGVGALCVLTVVLAAIFRLLPRARVAWRDVFGGALVAACLLDLIKRLFTWYLGHIGSYAAYGTVGGFLGLMMWVYLASLILFYGAEFSRVYAERSGSLAKQPVSPRAVCPGDSATSVQLVAFGVGAPVRDQRNETPTVLVG